jgi:MoaA/NifB/PqqE/SkfB family radical SAM enzyme
MTDIYVDTSHDSARTSAPPDLMRGLEFLWLELTNRCNLQCAHCYSSSSPYEPESYGLQWVEWVRVLCEARTLGCRSVQFIGGEPLLYPALPDLIREARRLDYYIIEVFTNGTRLSDELVRLFADNGVMLATSFYSDDACSHDSITGVRGSQQKTIKAIERAVAAGIPTRVGVITMPENEARAQATVHFLRALGVEHVRLDRVRGIGRGHTFTNTRNPQEELCGACWRGRLALNSAGDVSLCVFSHFHKVGHISDGLATILESPALRTFRQEIRYMDETRRMASCRPMRCDPSDCDPGVCAPEECSPNTCLPECSPWNDVGRAPR